MERLTRRINGVVVYVGAKNPYSTGQIPCEVEPAGVREMMDRLAAYEDTWLTPKETKRMSNILMDVGIDYNCSWEYVKNWLLNDRLRELAEADKGGRVAVLPVKPVLTPILSSMLYIIEDGDICEDALYEAVVGMSENGEMNVVYTTLSDQITFEQADIGKTVFLTREEAEKALEAMKND
jgi:hypothetical protein